VPLAAARVPLPRNGTDRRRSLAAPQAGQGLGSSASAIGRLAVNGPQRLQA
jgi:hypothetical protein